MILLIFFLMTQLKKKPFYRFNQVELKNLHICKAGKIPRSNRWKTCRLENHDLLKEDNNSITISPVRKKERACWRFQDPIGLRGICFDIE